MGTGSHFQSLLGPAPLPWTGRVQGQKGPRPQGRRWHPRKPSQAGWPASLPFKDRLSLQIPWGPLGGYILLPSPGTLAGPGVSAGLLSSPFPGQQSEAGPGERCLCWLFRVVHCAVCVLLLDSPEISTLTLTVHQTQILPWTEIPALRSGPARLCQAEAWLACSDLTAESACSTACLACYPNSPLAVHV